MIRKLIIILILSCTVGVGYVLAETEMGSFPLFNTEVLQVPKKISAVKSKSFYSKQKALKDKQGFSSDQYSFFQVLNDPSLSKMVDLKGKVFKIKNNSPNLMRKVRVKKKILRKADVPVSPVRIEKAILKVDAPPLPLSKPKKTTMTAQRNSSDLNLKPVSVITIPVLSERVVPKKVALKQKPKELLSTLATLESIPSGPVQPNKALSASMSKLVSFVVQVSASQQLQRSKELKGVLEKKGYPAFIGKTELPDNGGAWYRVYIGRYFDHAGAEMAANRFFRKENRKAMVFRQTG